MRRTVAASFAATWLLLCAAPALAHGDLQGSTPEDGSSVAKRPKQISLTLTEPPGAGTTVQITDGCKRNVPANVEQSGQDVTAAVNGGKPGRWHVRFRAVSSVDGHTTKGGIRFTVRGKKDCSKPRDGDNVDIGGGSDTLIESDDPPESTFPVVPVVIGSAVVIGIAFVLRKISSQ